MNQMSRNVLLVACGALAGAGLGSLPGKTLAVARPQSQANGPSPRTGRQNGKDELPEPADLPAEVARLKQLVPSQSHGMMDVAYHWTNLWFAGQHRNWPLAEFYFNESRQHIQWTIRIRPVRKGPDGKDVDLQAIFDGIDTSSLAAVKAAIADKNIARFTSTYKTMLESCYACHKASGKPMLRPMVPLAPAQTIINFDSRASWPE